MALNKLSLVTLALCSGLVKQKDIKPYTDIQWNDLIMNYKSSELEQIFHSNDSTRIKRDLNLNDSEQRRVTDLLSNSADLSLIIEDLRKKGVNITTIYEKDYPQVLKNKLGNKAPLILYYAGDLSLLDYRAIGFVGSRDCDEEAKKFTKRLVLDLVIENYEIISGGARGIDSISEEGALKNSGKAISIVSDSLLKKIKIPFKRRKIISGDYLMISPFNPSIEFQAYNAMARNKYIYILSEAVIVVSSGDKGGTWTGAVENLKNNYQKMYVRMDSTVPEGNKKLISLGAEKIDAESVYDDNFSVSEFLDPENVQYLDKEEFFEDEDEDIDDIDDEYESIIDLDVYYLVMENIKKALYTPRTKDDLIEILNVKQGQLNEWIKRAKQDGYIKKKNDKYGRLVLEKQTTFFKN